MGVADLDLVDFGLRWSTTLHKLQSTNEGNSQNLCQPNPGPRPSILGYPVACTGDLPIIFSFTSLQVKGACEMYSLSKLFKTLSAAMPSTKVKILKMSKQATTKQFLDNLS